MLDPNLKKDEAEQLTLGLKLSPFQFIYKFRDRFYLFIKAFETKRYFRDPYVWLFLCLTTTTIAIQITYILNYYSAIPDAVPLFQNYLQLEKRLISKEAVLAIPVVSFLLLATGISLSSKKFAHYKIISSFALYYVTISTSLLTFILINLFANYNA